MIDLSKVSTEGFFEHRMKPGIVHAAQIVCRAVEEIQKIIVANKDSAEKYKALIEDLTKRVAQLEAKLNGEQQKVVESQDQPPA